MAYRRFGRTELQMPVFSCGGMRYQHKWQDIPLDEVPDEAQQNLEATIRRAVEVGINHIETARGYGSSERQLGLILPTFPRDKIIVQTKIGPEDDPGVFTKHFEESLERLQLDHVDLLALHGVNDRAQLDKSIRKGGCLQAARKLQQQGLAKHIGLSTHADTDVILDAIRHDNDGGFDYINLHWYYIFQKHWPCIEEATARDMGIFIISPTDKGGKLYDPPQRLKDLTAPLHPIVFNDLWCLSHPQVHTLSVGASRPDDFNEHLDALPLLNSAERTLRPILDRLDAAMRESVEPELRDPFALDLPPWQDAPGGVNLATILWLRTLTRAYDMKGYGQMRYNLLGNGGHWFPGENAEKAGELDLSDVARRSGLGDRLVPLLQETHDILAKEKVKRLSQGG